MRKLSRDGNGNLRPPLSPDAPQKDTSLDGSHEDILNFLKSNSLILRSGNNAEETVRRIDFAANVVFHSGFYEYIQLFNSEGYFSDLEAHSENEKLAEIAVNQGYIIKPVGKTPWNYAFAEENFETENLSVGEIPFSSENPPVVIKTKMKKILWEYEDGYENICAKTPVYPLVELSDAENVLLYPYGCAKLRMTEMPLSK